MKKWCIFGTKCIFSAGMIWFVLRGVDINAVYNITRDALPLPLVLGSILLLLHVVIVSWRWRAVLKSISAHLRFRDIIQFSYISIFFNQVLPASVGGDAIRVYKAYQSGLGLRSAFNSIVLDRIASLVSIAILMLVSFPLLLTRINDPNISMALIVVTLSALTGFVSFFYFEKLPRYFQRWFIARELVLLSSCMKEAFLCTRHFLHIMGISILGHLNLSLSIWLMALSLDINISILDCLILFPPVLLLSSLPISIAGWGIREGAMIIAFGFVGVSSNLSFTLSVLFGLASIIINIPAGILWSVTAKNKIVDLSDKIKPNDRHSWR